MGKIFHPGGVSGDNDINHSWSPASLPYFDPPAPSVSKYAGKLAHQCATGDGSGCEGWASVNIDSSEMQDLVMRPRGGLARDGAVE